MQDKTKELPDANHRFPTLAEMEMALKRRVEGKNANPITLQEALCQLKDMEDNIPNPPLSQQLFPTFEDFHFEHFSTIADWEADVIRLLKDKTFVRRLEGTSEGTFIVYDVYNDKGEVVTEHTALCNIANITTTDDSKMGGPYPTIADWEADMILFLKDKTFVRRLETSTKGSFIIYDVYNEEGDVCVEHSMQNNA
jgi:hypothetical protein